MDVPCQRWVNGRDRYRPAGEVIQTADYEVAPIANKPARDFVLAHHYSGRYPAARRRFGLYTHGELVGVAVFSQPVSNRCLTRVFPGVPFAETVELGRFVLLDRVPGNGETWFLSRCFRLLRHEGFAGVISYSDPCCRTNVHGERVFAGHVGRIYQAHNARYLGRSRPSVQRLLPDGTVFSPRAASKIRNHETGWRYAVKQLVTAGAPMPTTNDLRSWCQHVVPMVTRRTRHGGNHKYAWGLTRAAEDLLGASLPYPKSVDAA